MSTAILDHIGPETLLASDRMDRDQLLQHVERVVLHPEAIEIQLRQTTNDQGGARDQAPPQGAQVLQWRDHARSEPDAETRILSVPWSGLKSRSQQGLMSEPSGASSLEPRTRSALLLAIAKARSWIDDLLAGRVATFADIAVREGKVERHVRLLVPLAFLSPRIVAAIIDDRSPSHLTVTALARALPQDWTEQEQRLGLH